MMYFSKQNLLQLIRPYLPENPIIVEAGAFDGTDTKKLSAFWPKGTVHAFEPVPEIFQLLTEKTQHLSNVVRHHVALSEKNGAAQFYVSEKPSAPGKPFQAGSLLQPKERLEWSDAIYKTTIEVPTITIKDWARKQSIKHIDFLWLDAQGHELAILKGAQDLLNTVTVIYTEVQFVHAYENQPLYEEVKAWLQERGFKQLAQDFKDQTSWFYGNVIFVKN